MKIVEYKKIYIEQIIRLCEEFQDYLVRLDPLKRLRRLPGYGEMYFKKMLRDVKKNKGIFYVAVEDGVVAGFVIAELEKMEDGSSLWIVPTKPGKITELFVNERYRGQGIGTKLIKKAEEFLKNSGCDVVKLEVFVPNVNAQKLYEKLGYEPRDIVNIKKL